MRHQSDIVFPLCLCLALITLQQTCSVSSLRQVYVYNDTKLTWYDANRSCAAQGAKLATIDSSFKFKLAALAILDNPDSTLWAMSLTDTPSAGRVWIADDEVSSQPSLFGNCYALESSLEGHLFRDELRKFDCHENHGFLCLLPSHSQNIVSYDFSHSDLQMSWTEASAWCSRDGGIITPIDSFATKIKASLILTNTTGSCSWVGTSTFSSIMMSGSENLVNTAGDVDSCSSQ